MLKFSYGANAYCMLFMDVLGFFCFMFTHPVWLTEGPGSVISYTGKAINFICSVQLKANMFYSESIQLHSLPSGLVIH